MDSRSVFHDLTLGVENDISGLVAMFAVADALSKVGYFLQVHLQMI